MDVHIELSGEPHALASDAHRGARRRQLCREDLMGPCQAGAPLGRRPRNRRGRPWTAHREADGPVAALVSFAPGRPDKKARHPDGMKHP